MGPIRLRILWSRIRRTLWFTPALYAVIALLVLSTAPLVGRMLPSDFNSLIGLDGVYDLLDVLSNSLLAVSIFSLGIMASSLQAAAGAATPRARPLLTEDRTAQNAISTFLGGFIYGIVGLVGLSTNFYGDEAKVILFLVTCAVIMAVIVALIRWVGRLSNLGDVSEVIDLVEQAADRAFAADAAEPWLGGVPMTELPKGRSAVLPDRMGFVQAINVAELARLADEWEIDLYVAARPGAYADPNRPLLLAGQRLDTEQVALARACFVIGGQRTFEADPRFAMIVLSETASRALSPGVNDPGTAIDVIGTSSRVLADWAKALEEAKGEVRHRRLHVGRLSPEDVLEDAFRWIARDGVGQLEVQIRLQRALAALSTCAPQLFGHPARALSEEALLRAEQELTFDGDLDRLRAEAARLGFRCPDSPRSARSAG
ncbi:DUF2254 domain-containing protein [Cereibacter sphaeroides]|uniref:DUF2254 domain-containing protein n=1 Tax=Cereibacter sphaeroides TaxID=1063 RepID=UPI000E5AA5A2|nr:DUF2254 domain-containing protein [Cereibacter sphaeroides]RHZ99661.1 DUF2254 domain-containing protein [Cereibacter sphaeroides]